MKNFRFEWHLSSDTLVAEFGYYNTSFKKDKTSFQLLQKFNWYQKHIHTLNIYHDE